MSRYRRGHYRRSPNGGYHYVRGHEVRFGGRSSKLPRDSKPQFKWVHPMPDRPNAVCPVCGAPVFFWKNERGSKVWFDSIGFPWPKHPCLDLSAISSLDQALTSQARSFAEGPLPQAQRVENAELASPALTGCGCLVLAPVLIVPVALVLGWAVRGVALGVSNEMIDVLIWVTVTLVILAAVAATTWVTWRSLTITAQAQRALDLGRRMGGPR